MADPFFSATCRHGVVGDAIGGLDDRRGLRWLCIDVDGTRQALIQRSVPRDPAYGGGLRRTPAATAPGYTGRKRGDAVRTRTVVQQAHTSEWLGTFSAPGNGSLESLMPRVLATVSSYLVSRSWPAVRTLLRFDGEHGRFPEIERLVESGMGFVVRGVVYSLLRHPHVRAALAAGTTVSLTHPDTGVARELFDVPELSWKSPSGSKSCTVRVIVARSRKDPTRPVRIGKLISGSVYELFVTTVESKAFHAADIVSMYLHRGQFEATLAQEDRELPADHWISYSPCGEDIWQIVCQWVWNLELWLGMHDAPPSAVARITDFTPPIEVLARVVNVTAKDLDEPSAPEAMDDDETQSVEHPATVAQTTAASSAQSTPSADCSTQHTSIGSQRSDAVDGAPIGLVFQRDSDGTMRCPTGQPMRVVETRQLKEEIRQRLQAADAACASCPMRVACRGANAESMGGRRINVAPDDTRVKLNGRSLRIGTPLLRRRPPPAPLVSTPDPTEIADVAASIERTDPPASSTNILWNDLPARAIRKRIQHGLESLKVTIVPVAAPIIAAPVSTEPQRNLRAHRRHTWLWSIRRNAALPDQPRVVMRIHGIPRSLAHALAIPEPS